MSFTCIRTTGTFARPGFSILLLRFRAPYKRIQEGVEPVRFLSNVGACEPFDMSSYYGHYDSASTSSSDSSSKSSSESSPRPVLVAVM